MIPQLEAPPRVRVEWLVAGTRVALAGGILLAIALDPASQAGGAAYLLGWYLTYSIGVLALVWTPLRFGPGWDVVVHLVDLTVFSLWILLPDSSTNPVIVYYVFLVICATLRWQMTGTMWTAAAAILAHAGVSLYMANTVEQAAFEPNAFAVRTVYLVLIAALVGYLGTHQHRFQHEISRLAAWPRQLPRDPRDLVAEIIRQSSEFLGAPRIVLAWEEPGEGWVNVASHEQAGIVWTHESDTSYESLVVPELRDTSFQALDADKDDGIVLLLRAPGVRRRQCRPLNESLRARFGVRSVQSWPLNGELIRGRLFCLDKGKMRIDELILGEVVAWLAVSRLESLYFQQRLREAAALEERVRVARDLHDSLLQAQAGAALQLLAARRLLDRDPHAGRKRLEEVQRQLERDELEMRSFVRRLRPATRAVPAGATMSLEERLQELRQRIERQWEIHVNLHLDATHGAPDAMHEDAFRLVQESIVNAARHADASVIDVTVSVVDKTLRLRVADDGRGFPFFGTYDLEALNRMNDGPLTLRERVAALGGKLTLTSSETGTELMIALPVSVHA